MADILDFKQAKERKDKENPPTMYVVPAEFSFIQNGKVRTGGGVTNSLEVVYDTAIEFGYKPYTRWNIVRNWILKNPLWMTIGDNVFYVRNRKELEGLTLTIKPLDHSNDGQENS